MFIQHNHIYVYVCVCGCVYVYVCVCVCVYIYIYICKVTHDLKTLLHEMICLVLVILDGCRVRAA